MIPKTIMRKRLAPVKSKAATAKERLMIPANGRILLFGKMIAKSNSTGTKTITVTQNSLRPAKIGQSKPM